jgi:hypothetical protein
VIGLIVNRAVDVMVRVLMRLLIGDAPLRLMNGKQLASLRRQLAVIGWSTRHRSANVKLEPTLSRHKLTGHDALRHCPGMKNSGVGRDTELGCLPGADSLQDHMKRPTP